MCLCICILDHYIIYIEYVLNHYYEYFLDDHRGSSPLNLGLMLIELTASIPLNHSLASFLNKEEQLKHQAFLTPLWSLTCLQATSFLHWLKLKPQVLPLIKCSYLVMAPLEVTNLTNSISKFLINSVTYSN